MSKLYRQQHAAPVLAKMRAWLDASLPSLPPGTLTGKALNYLYNQWPKLIRANTVEAIEALLPWHGRTA